MSDNFDFDLERMKKAVESPTVYPPADLTTADDFRHWLLDEANRLEQERLIELCQEKSYTMPSGLTREERHAWAKQTLAAHEFNQQAQEILCSRGKKPGIPAPSSKGLTLEQYQDKIAHYQRQIRLYSVIVEGTKIDTYPEGLYWEHIEVETRIRFGTLSFEDKMAVYRMYLERECSVMTPSARDQAASVLLKMLRLDV